MRISMGIAAFAVSVSFMVPAHAVDMDKLNAAVAARTDEVKMRDQFRHPAETLAFFGIEPGMTVIDALPGSWYASILTPYLGDEGYYYGANYPLKLRKLLSGDRYEEAERMERNSTWVERFVTEIKALPDGEAKVGAFLMGGAPEELKGKVDAYVFFRALHHLNKFYPQILDEQAATAFELLKPGGVVGIVQHRSLESMPDEWARGFNGYVKQSRVIAAFTSAGFELEAVSDINANPKDRPTEKDFVWRLPPSLDPDNEADKPKNKMIGESNRMTLRFRKPE